MLKTKLSSLAVGALLAIGAAGSANALTIFAGEYKINFDNYDIGTTYGTTNGVQCGAAGAGGASAANITACDTAGSNSGSSSSTDSTGIFSISSISRVGGGPDLYNRGTTSVINGVTFGPFLTGVFGGITDYYVETSGALASTKQTLALGTGGWMKVFNNAADYDPSHGPNVTNLDAATYTGITSGTLFLDAVFTAGGAVAGEEASYFSSFNPTSLVGSGGGFLDFIGGTAQALFDTNSAVNNNFGISDATLSVTYKPYIGSITNPVPHGWLVYSTGDATGFIQRVPEPTSLALVSLAMLGIGAVARRSRR